MNVYLMAHTKNNLGDDLFTSMLTSRHPEVNFDIDIGDKEHTQSLKKFQNVNIMNQNRDLERIDVNKYDAIVFVGGSIFMEHNGMQYLKDFNKFIKHAKNNSVPFYYTSCNFGPYETEEYYEIAKDMFRHCKDVYFRDKYSYELFKDVESVRYAPDLILSYDLKNIEKKKDTVGISVIDLSIRKNLRDFENQYFETLKNNIEEYQKQGKKVYLYSFCKYEGDERAIEKLEKMIQDKENLEIVRYDGDIDKFLNIYSQMEYMICTRFHSMILSKKLNQKIFVLSYSDKVNHVIKDLELPFHIVDCKEIKKDTMFKLSEFKH